MYKREKAWNGGIKYLKKEGIENNYLDKNCIIWKNDLESKYLSYTGKRVTCDVTSSIIYYRQNMITAKQVF